MKAAKDDAGHHEGGYLADAVGNCFFRLSVDAARDRGVGGGSSLECQERLRRGLLSRHPSDDVQLTAGQSPCLVEADLRGGVYEQKD